MKIFILTLMLTFSVFTTRAYALFGHVAAEHERRQEAEQRLVTAQTQFALQQTITGRWRLISFVLATGCGGSLVIGAAVGSRGRKHAK